MKSIIVNRRFKIKLITKIIYIPTFWHTVIYKIINNNLLPFHDKNIILLLLPIK